jgi:hypothetical protein
VYDFPDHLRFKQLPNLFLGGYFPLH